MSDDELKAISERYERRKSIANDRYSRLNWAVHASVQERQTAIIKLLTSQGIRDLSTQRVLEVGCGTGSNLLELIQFGAVPENLVGNELLPDRIKEARARLPEAVRLFAGDASQLPLQEDLFDIVYQSTVFSSVLDDALQASLACKMWSLARPGGGILWYDFTFNNPNNPDVRGVTLSRIHELFPEGKLTIRRVTLAPPIARMVVRLHPMLYSVCNVLPVLRTHLLCYIQKP